MTEADVRTRMSADERREEIVQTAVADRLIDQFGAESVWIKIAKPEPPIPLPVEEVAVELWRERE